MDARDITRRRMHGQRLWGRPLGTPQEVVGWLGAMQAQELPVARWSVAQRSRSVGAAEIDRLVAEGAILRTHVLRPTWHFVLPDDIRWLQALTAGRVHRLTAHRYRQLDLDGKLLARSDVMLARALEGAHLTRRELGVALERAGIDTSGQRLAHMVMHAELEALVCSGTPRDKQHTYAPVDERAPHAATLDRDEALAELTRRYFTTRGPATLRDYLWWSSLTAADGRRGLDMVGVELRKEAIDGRTYWWGERSRPRKPSGTRVDLVQVYDEMVVSYTESRDVLAANSIVRASGGFMHVVLIDGRWAGRWRSVRTQDSVVVRTSFPRQLRRDETEVLEGAVRRFGRFLGAPAVLG